MHPRRSEPECFVKNSGSGRDKIYGNFFWLERDSRDHFLREPHHTEQKIHLFNIDESKNVCLHFTSQADVG